MSFPAYSEYKNSEVDWLGHVPAKWEVVAYKRLVDIQNGADHKAVQQDDGYPVYGSGGVFTYASQYLFEGEAVLLGRKGTIDKPLYVDGAFWTVDTMYWAKIRYGVNGRFAYYAATTIPFAYYKTNTAVPSMTQTALGDHRVPRPPLGEQRTIAAFLDRETAKIDAAVAAQERLIALLAEKRAAIISHAVTTGLDPDVPRKGSGIEWLGQIPAHWDAKRLRFLCKIETGDGDTQDAVENGDYPFFVRSPNVEGINRYSFDCEAVMTSGDGAGVGKIYHHHVGKFTAHQRVYVFHGFDGILPRLVYHYFKAYFARVTLQGTAKSTVESLRRPMLADFWIVVPDESEQAAVLNFCEATEQKYNGAIERCEEGIRLLRERRAALISAAVTGKIDVRGEVTADNVVSLDEYRATVGAIAIAKLGKMGRMAVMKAGYLAEAYAGMHELEGHYERNAAGPYCLGVVRGMERGAADRHGIIVRENESKASYDLPADFEVPVGELRDRFGIDRANRFLSLMTDLSGFSREGVEAIATLYAGWNDLLSRDGDVTDDAVYREVLDNWHSEKREKFNTDTLSHWMDWMRRNGVVPDGTAPRTDHQASLI